MICLSASLRSGSYESIAHRDSPLNSGSHERSDCHFWRVHFVGFGDGRVLQSLVFSVCKAVTAFDRRVANNLERFNNALPQKAALKYFYHGGRSDVTRHATEAFFYSTLDVEDSVGHPSTMSTTRQTVPVHNLNDGVTWSKGSHTLQFGTNLRFINSFSAYYLI